MSELVLVGLSHRTAKVEVREPLAAATADLGHEATALRALGLEEAMLVSTCNRVEVYAAAGSAREAERALVGYFRARGGEAAEAALYRHEGEEAVRHAFRVAASLDSLVVGEPQILGQVKQSFEAGRAAGTVGTMLSRCFSRAFAVAKRVRSETGIAEGTVSISSVAVELATSIFGELRGRRVLLLGAGEMAEAAARSLREAEVTLRVVNRSLERAQTLASKYGGEARPYEALLEEIGKADVLVSSTASPGYVLTHETFRDVVRARRGRPIFVIDIAVPRDVDPKVSSLDGVFLYDVDDLARVAEENLRARRAEAEAAERIVEVEVREFAAWQRSLELGPTIVALRERTHAIVRAELERSLGKALPRDEATNALLDRTAHALVGKLVHAPLAALKAAADDRGELVSAARRLHALDAEAPLGKAEEPARAAPAQSPTELTRTRETG